MKKTNIVIDGSYTANTYELLVSPDINELVDENGWITGVVAVSLNDLVNNNELDLWELLTWKLSKNNIITDISYKLVGCDPLNEEVHLKVTGHIDIDMSEVPFTVILSSFSDISTIVRIVGEDPISISKVDNSRNIELKWKMNTAKIKRLKEQLLDKSLQHLVEMK